MTAVAVEGVEPSQLVDRNENQKRYFANSSGDCLDCVWPRGFAGPGDRGV